MTPPNVSLMPLAALLWPALALLGVLALILLTQRIARASGWVRRQGGQRLSVIEALAIDPRRRLQLVRCDDRTVLLLTGGTNDLVVGWLADTSP